MKVAEEENWIGPITSTPSGPVQEVLKSLALNYDCWAGGVPCDYPTPPLHRVISDSKTKTHAYSVSGNVSLEAGTSLALKLIVDAKASVSFDGTFSNRYEETFTISLDFWQPWCSRFEYLDTVEKWTASGSVTDADYRITWCNSCVCGDVTYTLCGPHGATGTAQGYTHREVTSSWDTTCDCWFVDCNP